MTPIDSPLYGHADMYLAGDEIVSASISDPAAAGTSEGLLQPLVGSATSGANKSNAITTLLPLTSSSKANNRANSSATLSPLFSAGSNKRYATSTAFMLPITGEAEAEPGVQLITSLGEMQPLWGESSGLTGGVGQSEGAIGPLFVAASEGSYGESSAKIGPLTSLSGENFYKSSGVFVSGPPSPRLRANGRSSQGENSFTYRAPMATLSAFGGGNAKLQAPAAGLSASATGTNWGNAAIETPSVTLSATGTTSATASAALEAPTARLVGYGGAVASITLTGKNTIQATGTAGGIGGAALTVPLFQLVAGAKAENYGGANLLAPSPRMGDRLQAWLTAPSARLTAIGSATITATYEAYSVNLNHVSDGGGDKKETTIDEVTRYTNFPFTHVVRYQNSYYGANSTGLYLLEGATDDTAPISWAVTTGMMEFGSPKMKTVASAYFGGRFGPASTITLSAGEKTPVPYSFSTPRDALAKNHRQVFGRGVKARYYTLAVSGEGECELDDITFGIHTTTRRI